LHNSGPTAPTTGGPDNTQDRRIPFDITARNKSRTERIEGGNFNLAYRHATITRKGRNRESRGILSYQKKVKVNKYKKKKKGKECIKKESSMQCLPLPPYICICNVIARAFSW